MKFYLDLHWVTRPSRRTLTNGSDVKYVFPLTNGSDVKGVFSRCQVLVHTKVRLSQPFSWGGLVPSPNQPRLTQHDWWAPIAHIEIRYFGAEKFIFSRVKAQGAHIRVVDRFVWIQLVQTQACVISCRMSDRWSFCHIWQSSPPPANKHITWTRSFSRWDNYQHACWSLHSPHLQENSSDRSDTLVSFWRKRNLLQRMRRAKPVSASCCSFLPCAGRPSSQRPCPWPRWRACRACGKL